MAGTSAYPGSVDSFADNTDWTGDPNAAPASARITASDVNNLQASVQAIETTVGVNPQGSAASVAARIAAIETGGAVPVVGVTTAWATGTVYGIGATVTFTGLTYLCRSGHTSGVFATDLSNNRWVALDVAQALTRTTVKTANYTASPGDLVPVDTTSGNVTVTLPTTPPDRTRIAVKQVTRGGTNTVTVAAGGTDVFNVTAGPTTRTLTVQGESVVLDYTASAGVWTVTASDVPLSQLDTRYDATGAATTAAAAAQTAAIGAATGLAIVFGA